MCYRILGKVKDGILEVGLTKRISQNKIFEISGNLIETKNCKEIKFYLDEDLDRKNKVSPLWASAKTEPELTCYIKGVSKIEFEYLKEITELPKDRIGYWFLDNPIDLRSIIIFNKNGKFWLREISKREKAIKDTLLKKLESNEDNFYFSVEESGDKLKISYANELILCNKNGVFVKEYKKFDKG